MGQAQAELDRLASLPPSRPRSMAESGNAIRLFSEALDHVPDNPWALEGQAVIALAQIRLSAVPKQARDLAAKARVLLQQAIRVRPTSPYLWANLALSKLYLDEVDAEFIQALGYADELGPWEPATQEIVLFAGLAAWPSLGPAQRQRLAAAVERGGVRNALKMFEIVKSFQRIELVCGLGSYDVVAREACGKAFDAGKAAIPATKSLR